MLKIVFLNHNIIVDNDLNTSNDKLKLLEERYGLSNDDEEEDYSENHSIAEEDVLNKIETLYDELNDIAKGITKPGNLNNSKILFFNVKATSTRLYSILMKTRKRLMRQK